MMDSAWWRRRNEIRKKPTAVVEAFCFDGDLEDKNGEWYVPDWAVEAYEKGVLFYKDAGELYVKTLEGGLHVSVGDYVVRGVEGELYPVRADIFKKTYIPVQEPVFGYCPYCGKEMEAGNDGK